MKIDVGTVQQQLNSENNELSNSMQSTYELLPDILEFIQDTQLLGMAYNQFKGHMVDVTQSLIKAICCMLESKIGGNTKYLSALNQYLSGMGKVDLDELISKKQNMETSVENLKGNAVVGAVTAPYTAALGLVINNINNINNKIQKIEGFLAASQGCYQDFSEKYSVAMQGIAAAKALAYNSATSTCPNITNADMQWTQMVNNFYDERNREILQEKYGEYIKNNPGKQLNMMIIAEYERFHGDDAKKYDKLLDPLEEEDEINIKIITYNADQLYRDMMFKYADKYKIELSDEDGSYFSRSEDKIVLKENQFRGDKYQTFFHECGHAIDYNFSKENKIKTYTSAAFVGSNGITLDQSTENDVKNWTQTQAQKYIDSEYQNLSDAERKNMANNVTEFVMSKGQTTLTSAEEGILSDIQVEFANKAQGRPGALVSDTASGVTDFILLGDSSHLASGDKEGTYWTYNNGKTRHVPSSEYFAEYYGYNMTNNVKGLNFVSEMYPESKAVIDEMLYKIGNN